MRISLAPNQVAMVRFGRGLKPRVVDRKRIDCARAEGLPGAAGSRPGGTRSGENWGGAIEALRELLAHPNVGKARATVVLSSHFVRYMTVPWSAELVTRDEELAFARLRYTQVFGDAAQGWTVKLSPAPAGKARLAVAVDRALIERLSAAIAASPLTLAAVQPALMAQFNDWRRTIGDNTWLAVAERGRLLTAWIANGEWRAVRARPINGEAIALAQIIEQERLLLSAGAAPTRVCLAVVDDVAVDASGLRVERLGGALSASSSGGFALAMAGAVS